MTLFLILKSTKIFWFLSVSTNLRYFLQYISLTKTDTNVFRLPEEQNSFFWVYRDYENVYDDYANFWQKTYEIIVIQYCITKIFFYFKNLRPKLNYNCL